jgi:hypothetical protein
MNPNFVMTNVPEAGLAVKLVANLVRHLES